MTLGGFNQDMHLPGEKVQTLKWKQESSFVISVQGIYVNGDFSKNLMDSEKANTYNFMLDSGTTYIWVPPQVYDGILQHVSDYCK